MDPKKTKNGEPYAPYRYKELVREMYFLTRNGSITREDVLLMTPIEREYYIEFIQDELKRTKELFDQLKLQTKNKRR